MGKRSLLNIPFADLALKLSNDSLSATNILARENLKHFRLN